MFHRDSLSRANKVAPHVTLSPWTRRLSHCLNMVFPSAIVLIWENHPTEAAAAAAGGFFSSSHRSSRSVTATCRSVLKHTVFQKINQSRARRWSTYTTSFPNLVLFSPCAQTSIRRCFVVSFLYGEIALRNASHRSNLASYCKINRRGELRCRALSAKFSFCRCKLRRTLNANVRASLLASDTRSAMRRPRGRLLRPSSTKSL